MLGKHPVFHDARYRFEGLVEERLSVVPHDPSLENAVSQAGPRHHDEGVAPYLGHPVPVPAGVPWFPQDVDAWSVRWVALHLIAETARHAGHADIVREAIDGATAFPLLAAAEGWPATPWLTPWEPAAAQASRIERRQRTA